MGYPVHIDTIRLELSILSMYFKPLSVKIYKNIPALTNSADPDEMLLYAALHLGLHCLPKYLVHVSKGKKCDKYQPRTCWPIFAVIRQ